MCVCVGSTERLVFDIVPFPVNSHSVLISESMFAIDSKISLLTSGYSLFRLSKLNTRLSF
nr:MAG TPA: hypothetical protein [Caudoviricetes sp.]